MALGSMIGRRRIDYGRPAVVADYISASPPSRNRQHEPTRGLRGLFHFRAKRPGAGWGVDWQYSLSAGKAAGLDPREIARLN